MTITSQQKPEHSNQDKVDALALIVAMRMDELLSELGVKFYKSGKKYIGQCPIHGGDRADACNLYPDGHSVPGLWKCRSNECHIVFKRTILGFIRGVLSHDKYNWKKKGDKMVSWEETLQWACKFVKQDFSKLEVDKEEIERRRFTATMHSVNVAELHEAVHALQGIPRNKVRENLIIPADYFINRGYSPEILSTYDVGVPKQGREMAGRVVVPIYDVTNNLMIGFTGRSIYNQCKDCGCYHAPNTHCPAEEYKWLYSKWKHKKDFQTSSCLYNYWRARKYIQESGVVILVEGPADVWRLEECGIHNAVAIFGIELSDEQQVILETSGAMSVVILLDNDEAGYKGKEEIEQKLERFYNLCAPGYEGHDVGGLSCEYINRELVPIIKSIEQKQLVMSF